MEPVEEHWLSWWKIDDSLMDGSNYTPKQKSLKATGGWKQSSTGIQIGVLKFKYRLPLSCLSTNPTQLTSLEAFYLTSGSLNTAWIHFLQL